MVVKFSRGYGSQYYPVYITSSGTISSCSTVQNSYSLGGVNSTYYMRNDKVNFYQHNIYARINVSLSNSARVGYVNFSFISTTSTTNWNNDMLLLRSINRRLSENKEFFPATGFVYNTNLSNPGPSLSYGDNILGIITGFAYNTSTTVKLRVTKASFTFSTSRNSIQISLLKDEFITNGVLADIEDSCFEVYNESSS